MWHGALILSTDKILVNLVINIYRCTVVMVLQDMQGTGMNGSGASQVVFRLVVPNANCGSLIGKGGNNIRELREV